MLDTPTDPLDHSARTRPGGLAVADATERLTYAELRERSGALAATLADLGVGPGDHVAIDLPAGVPHAVALHGSILAGAVVQSLPPRGRAGVDVAPGAALVDAETIERSRRRAGAEWRTLRRHPRAPLTRVLSSGTSGEPKAVELTAGNHLWSALASAANLGVARDDAWLCCLPLNHVGGLSILVRSAVYGTAALIHDGFDVERVAAAIGGGEASIVSLVPTQLVRLLEAGAAIERPRLILLGGGPVPLEVLDEALERGASVVQTYGLTEACSQVCTLAPESARELAGSAGRPLLGVEVAAPEGEIRVRGPIVAPGSVAADGWLLTGDLGRIDDEGCLWVEGRREDLIVTGGENVRPERVESALASHPGVAEVAVAGIDDREWGQAVVAFVVPRAGSELRAEDLEALARRDHAPHEVPKRYVVVTELPRTATGKLQRRRLADAL